NRIDGHFAQRSTYGFVERLVSVVLLHAGSSGVLRRVIAGTEDNLTGHGQRQCVRSSFAFKEPQNRVGSVSEVVDQPTTQAGAHVVTGLLVSLCPFVRRRPEQ